MWLGSARRKAWKMRKEREVEVLKAVVRSSEFIWGVDRVT